MAPLDFLSTFRDREGEDNVLKAKWYIAAVWYSRNPEYDRMLLSCKGNWSNSCWGRGACARVVPPGIG